LSAHDASGTRHGISVDISVSSLPAQDYGGVTDTESGAALQPQRRAQMLRLVPPVLHQAGILVVIMREVLKVIGIRLAGHSFFEFLAAAADTQIISTRFQLQVPAH
jgi:hypothetical protein